MNNLDDIITDVEILGSRTLYREGFAFTSLGNVGNPANIFDAIIIHNPTDAKCFSPKLGSSTRSLQEHIDFINYHNLEKAVVIAEDIAFLPQCPTLKYLEVIPSDNASSFDFSPLYDMPCIMGLNCTTEYGLHFSKKTSIDYQHFHGLCDLDIAGSGHINTRKVSSLRRLSVSRNPAHELSEIVSGYVIESLNLTNCKIRSVSGIDKLSSLSQLFLWHNRSLAELSKLTSCAGSLKSLSIVSCNKVTDFSFLDELPNLESLELIGNNTLHDLSFLQKMKNLRCFTFDMNVLDGDLTYCRAIPYVHSLRNRKHYNLTDRDLPKNR